MSSPLFSQNIIAIIWDFDKTLIPSYMQDPLFRHFDVDANTFWKESRGLERVFREKGCQLVARDSLYLIHMLTYVRNGKFPGLNNALLRKLGEEIKFCPGIPELFEHIKEKLRSRPEYTKAEIQVEHYIVSTGLRQMIVGSSIYNHVSGVWGCEFVEGVPAPGYLAKPTMFYEPDDEITDIAYTIDNTSKTRAVFEINKGSNKYDEIDVNASLDRRHRRIPFEHMIYIADGPSDIPVFSIINQNGGKTFAVFGPQCEDEFKQVSELQDQKRVHSIGPADYTQGSQTYMWIMNSVCKTADRIVSHRRDALGDQTGAPPRHLE